MLKLLLVLLNAYDKVGNFLKKTDYSANSTTAYRYGSSACLNKPNAVCQLTKLNGSTVNFKYDNRGNLRVGDGLTISYNAMDIPPIGQLYLYA